MDGAFAQFVQAAKKTQHNYDRDKVADAMRRALLVVSSPRASLDSLLEQLIQQIDIIRDLRSEKQR